jgi:hypothetical protein
MSEKLWLECGCVIGTEEDMFVIIPCSPDCKVLKFCIEESERQNKPMHILENVEAEK